MTYVTKTSVVYHIGINFTSFKLTFILPLMNTERLPVEENPGRSFYENTQRVKSVFFEPISPEIAVRELSDIWYAGRTRYDTPLVQVRAVIPTCNESDLISQTNNLNPSVEAKVNGRIPFQIDNQEYGIYYLQADTSQRKAYTHKDQLAHDQAVKLGLDKRRNHEARPIPQGYSIHAVEFMNGYAVDLLSGVQLNISVDELSREIIGVHERAFNYPHDPAQRTIEGAREILLNNPTVFALNSTGHVASVCYLERDTRFRFGNIALIEPTYFTDPQEEGLGLSSLLRQTVRILVEIDRRYRGSPMIIFNESIRHSSFLLCLENGYHLAGTDNLSISGNLGEAYTAIGPANPDAGYMPLGLTYLTDPRIKSK